MKKYQHCKYTPIYQQLIIILILITPLFSAYSQNNEKTDTKTWSLRLGSGVGYGAYRDLGTAPFSFKGATLMPDAGLSFTSGVWLFDIASTSMIGIYEDALKPAFNFAAFDVNNTVRIKLLRQLPHEGCPIRVGMAVSSFLDANINTNYENAAVGVSWFIYPEIIARIDDIPLGSKESCRFSLHGELGVAPAAWAMRPGYSFIDNYTATQPVLDAQFDNYQMSATAFACLSTDIGLNYRFKSNNSISISYLWNFHRSNGTWEYYHASHIVATSIIIKLK